MEDTFFCGGCDSRKPIEDKRMKNNRPRCTHCVKRTLRGTPPKVTGGPLTQEGSAEFSSDFVPYREQE